MTKNSKYNYLTVLQGMWDSKWKDIATYDHDNIKDHKTIIQERVKEDPRPYRFVNRRKPNPEYVKPEPSPRQVALQKLKDLCCSYLSTTIGNMRANMDDLLKTYGPALIDHENASVNLISLCVIVALMHDQEYDLVGNLNAKDVSKEIRRQNHAMKKLIDKIYATL